MAHSASLTFDTTVRPDNTIAELTLIFFLFIMCTTPAFSNNNGLNPCPDKPNCVSSLESGEHAIEPFTLIAKSSIDIQKLVSLIQHSDKKVSVIHADNRIHAEFTSRVFSFVDDMDLLINLEQNLIHVRSASRTGYYDFGVNKRRVENLRLILKEEGIIQ